MAPMLASWCNYKPPTSNNASQAPESVNESAVPSTSTTSEPQATTESQPTAGWESLAAIPFRKVIHTFNEMIHAKNARRPPNFTQIKEWKRKKNTQFDDTEHLSMNNPLDAYNRRRIEDERCITKKRHIELNQTMTEMMTADYDSDDSNDAYGVITANHLPMVLSHADYTPKSFIELLPSDGVICEKGGDDSFICEHDWNTKCEFIACKCCEGLVCCDCLKSVFHIANARVKKIRTKKQDWTCGPCVCDEIEITKQENKNKKNRKKRKRRR
eukprot:700798_1